MRQRLLGEQWHCIVVYVRGGSGGGRDGGARLDTEARDAGGGVGRTARPAPPRRHQLTPHLTHPRELGLRWRRRHHRLRSSQRHSLAGMCCHLARVGRSRRVAGANLAAESGTIGHVTPLSRSAHPDIVAHPVAVGKFYK